jgi:hypothetical protein
MEGTVSTEYKVSPQTIGGVPWSNLQAGDVVRLEPGAYHCKFNVYGVGSADKPIVIEGVLSEKGEMPVLFGDGAVACTEVEWQEQSIVQVGNLSALLNGGEQPQHIHIRNIKFSGAHPTNTFLDNNSNPGNYSLQAAGLFVVTGNNIHVSRCVFANNANGLVTWNRVSEMSIKNCRFYNNGVAEESDQNNSQCEVDGMLYEGNWYGPLIENARGSNIQDRSANMTLRYNWIEGGDPQIELAAVSPEFKGVKYHVDGIYGNIVIAHQIQRLSNTMIKVSSDFDEEDTIRAQNLYIDNNTFIAMNTNRTVLLSINPHYKGFGSVHNNIFHGYGGELYLLEEHGEIITRSNWLRTDVGDICTPGNGAVKEALPSIRGTDPGFLNPIEGKFQLAYDSPCINRGCPFGLSVHKPVDSEYEKHQNIKAVKRKSTPNIGAYGPVDETGNTLVLFTYEAQINNNHTGKKENLVVVRQVANEDDMTNKVKETRKELEDRGFAPGRLISMSIIGTGHIL